MNDHRFTALDGLRGVAVLLVFCVHAAGNTAGVTLGVNLDQVHLGGLLHWDEQVLYWVFKSHHGVFLFFVLSGFLIGRMWWPVAKVRYRTFAWRRTLRIYPAFFVAFLVSLAFALWSGTWQPPDIPRLLANLLLLYGAPGIPIDAFNVVTWSLFYEMSFYLVFPVFAMVALARGPRAGPWLWAIGIALPVVASLLGADPLVLCWSLLFVGVALAVHEAPISAFAARLPSVVVLTCYFGVTTLALFELLPPTPAILLFGGATLLVIAKSLAPGNVIAGFLSLPPLRALGRISYSFYLVHWMPIVLIARIVWPHAPALGRATATLIIFGGGFALSAIAATALWWIAERPYFARARRA